MDEFLGYVASLLPGGATPSRPSVPFGADPAAGALPATQQARDYLIEEMKRHLQEANLL
jgi:hypothetical protein